MTRRDGEPDDPREPARRVTHATRKELRSMLLDAGIDIADPIQPPTREEAPARAVDDRAEIRAILKPLDCPEWAIESCPSLAHARAYRRGEFF